MTDSQILYAVAQTATMLGISPATVRKLAKDFRLDQSYIGKRMLITPVSIDRFVASLPMLPDPDF
jgi:hypothetical protein